MGGASESKSIGDCNSQKMFCKKYMTGCNIYYTPRIVDHTLTKQILICRDKKYMHGAH